jgi:hypothetical protein
MNRAKQSLAFRLIAEQRGGAYQYNAYFTSSVLHVFIRPFTSYKNHKKNCLIKNRLDLK